MGLQEPERQMVEEADLSEEDEAILASVWKQIIQEDAARCKQGGGEPDSP